MAKKSMFPGLVPLTPAEEAEKEHGRQKPLSSQASRDAWLADGEGTMFERVVASVVFPSPVDDKPVVAFEDRFDNRPVREFGDDKIEAGLSGYLKGLLR